MKLRKTLLLSLLLIGSLQTVRADLTNGVGWVNGYYIGPGANLTSANLTDANLTDADLTDADLTDADLTGANLTGANLTGANLTGANLDFANLSFANLSLADLSLADLSFADLTGANLSLANLTGANLSFANLTGADLFFANFNTATARTLFDALTAENASLGNQVGSLQAQVAALQAQLSNEYTLAEIVDLRAGSTMISIASNGMANLQFDLEESTNLLSSWTHKTNLAVEVSPSNATVKYYRFKFEE